MVALTNAKMCTNPLLLFFQYRVTKLSSGLLMIVHCTVDYITSLSNINANVY